jgi:ATP-dependent RNA helicase RhlE
MIQQAIYHVDKNDKQDLLIDILKDRSIETLLVFTQMKHAADKLSKRLIASGISAAAIHGNKSQNARQTALENFKNKRVRVLVATDIAARGIDIDQLSHVLNYELPNVPETYVHRIGRTGRAGASGIALSFCSREEKAYLRDIERLIKKSIPVKQWEGSSVKENTNEVRYPLNKTEKSPSSRRMTIQKRDMVLG